MLVPCSLPWVWCMRCMFSVVSSLYRTEVHAWISLRCEVDGIDVDDSEQLEQHLGLGFLKSQKNTSQYCKLHMIQFTYSLMDMICQNGGVNWIFTILHTLCKSTTWSLHNWFKVVQRLFKDKLCPVNIKQTFATWFCDLFPLQVQCKIHPYF